MVIKIKYHSPLAGTLTPRLVFSLCHAFLHFKNFIKALLQCGKCQREMLWRQIGISLIVKLLLLTDVLLCLLRAGSGTDLSLSLRRTPVPLRHAQRPNFWDLLPLRMTSLGMVSSRSKSFYPGEFACQHRNGVSFEPFKMNQRQYSQTLNRKKKPAQWPHQWNNFLLSYFPFCCRWLVRFLFQTWNSTWNQYEIRLKGANCNSA